MLWDDLSLHLQSTLQEISHTARLSTSIQDLSIISYDYVTMVYPKCVKGREEERERERGVARQVVCAER